MSTSQLRRIGLRRAVASLLSVTIIVCCLAWPSRLSGRLSNHMARTASAAAATNFVDDISFFTAQHYLDFLSREPDASGLQFWTNEITSCGSNAQCAEVKRINVSAAFFLSIEFQETGFLVYRTYKAAFGNIAGKPVPITFEEMLADMLLIRRGVVVGQGDWRQRLDLNQRAYFDALVTRSKFTSLYPQSMTSAQFVDALNVNAGGALSTAERNALVADLMSGAKTRPHVLAAVTADADLIRAEFNRAFVLMQYFGYLRRDPNEGPDSDFSGYNFWLSKLNQFGGNYIAAEMVKAFISSVEYRARFAQPSLSAFGNPGDPLLLRAKTARGETIDYFGGKDAQGHATALTSVSVKNKENQVTNIRLDNQGRPTQIQGFNGTSFKITWLSSTNILVTALSADGAIQVNIPFDLAAQGTPEASSCHSCASQWAAKMSGATQAPAAHRTSRSGVRTSLTVTPAYRWKGLPTPFAAALSGTSLVKVTRCGNPVNDADVGITVIPSSSPSDAYNAPGTLTGAGQYTVSIPTQPSAGQKAEDICGDIAGALSIGCDGLSVIPPGSEALLAAQLGAAVSAVATPAAGAAVFVAFEAAFIAARLYCDTLGFSPAPGAPSLLELICGNISEVVDRFTSGNLRLIPVVYIPGKGVIDGGSGVTAPSTGPFPTFNVDAGDKAEIVSFTTTPADPAPFEDYIAEALIQCAPTGTQVTISIVGTDGYRDSATATIPAEANVTLAVPGAEEGVTDTVTVTVSNGPTKTIVLVF